MRLEASTSRRNRRSVFCSVQKLACLRISCHRPPTGGVLVAHGHTSIRSKIETGKPLRRRITAKFVWKTTKQLVMSRKEKDATRSNLSLPNSVAFKAQRGKSPGKTFTFRCQAQREKRSVIQQSGEGGMRRILGYDKRRGYRQGQPCGHTWEIVRSSRCIVSFIFSR